MRRPVLILRPQPGADHSAARLKKAGLQPILAPLFAVEAKPWAMPDNVDSLLLGSANAVRHAGEKLAQLRALPCYCVGSATAKAAQKAGLDLHFAGESNLQDALHRLVRDGWRRPLRLCGQQHNILAPPDTIIITTVINYEAAATGFSDQHYAMLRTPALIMVHSARAMAHLEDAIHAAPDDMADYCAQHIIIAISQRCADAAFLNWGKIVIAPKPSDHDMVILAEKFMTHAINRVSYKNEQ